MMIMKPRAPVRKDEPLPSHKPDGRGASPPPKKRKSKATGRANEYMKKVGQKVGVATPIRRKKRLNFFPKERKSREGFLRAERKARREGKRGSGSVYWAPEGEDVIKESCLWPWWPQGKRRSYWLPEGEDVIAGNGPKGSMCADYEEARRKHAELLFSGDPSLGGSRKKGSHATTRKTSYSGRKKQLPSERSHLQKVACFVQSEN